jgi:hypothetical protein
MVHVNCYVECSFFFNLVFYHPSFSLFFLVHVLSLFFLAHVVSSLAYPNLLGIKRLGCCCNAVFFVCNPLTVNISGEAMLVLGGVLAPGFIFFYQGIDPF